MHFFLSSRRQRKYKESFVLHDIWKHIYRTSQFNWFGSEMFISVGFNLNHLSKNMKNISSHTVEFRNTKTNHQFKCPMFFLFLVNKM